MKKGIIGVVGGVFLVVVFVFFCCTETVGVGKEKAGAVFGKVQSTPLTSGFHVVNPLASYEVYDVQKVTYNFDNVAIPAQDKLVTTVDAAVTGSFIPGMACAVRKETGSAAGFINTHYTARVKAVLIEIGKGLAVNSQDFYGKTTLDTLAREAVIRLNKELNPLGYRVYAIKFSDIRLPKVVTDAVVKTKKREQEIEEQEATLKIVSLKAQEATKKAEAAMKSAEFEKKAAQLVTDAAAYDIIKKAEAQAEANKLISSSFTQKLEKFMYAEAAKKWNGVRSHTVLGDNTPVLLNR